MERLKITQPKDKKELSLAQIIDIELRKASGGMRISVHNHSRHQPSFLGDTRYDIFSFSKEKNNKKEPREIIWIEVYIYIYISIYIYIYIDNDNTI